MIMNYNEIHIMIRLLTNFKLNMTVTEKFFYKLNWLSETLKLIKGLLIHYMR